MGYGMYFVERLPKDREKSEELIAAEKARDAQFDVVRGMDRISAEREDAETEYYRLDAIADRLSRPDYFRLNIWGMGHYLDAMDDLGMVHDSDGPTRADWDALPDFDEGKYGYDTEEYETAYAEYRKSKAPLLSRHDTDNPTIPDHKFGTNDGWIVTPEEIRAALEAYERNKDYCGLSTPTQDLLTSANWDNWIDYMRRAAEHGGFEVH